MINKIKYEISENKKYIYMSYLISILTLVPQFIASPPLSSSKHMIFLFIALIVLFFISKFSKLLFLIFVIYINISNIIIGHIFFHWGYSHVDIQPRIDVAMVSPKYETYEYLLAYINYKDILLIVYTIFVFFMLYKFIKYFKHSFKIVKFLGFIFSIAIIVSISFYKNPLRDIEPFSIPYKCVNSTIYSKLFKLRAEYLNTLKPTSPIKNNKSMYDKVIIIQGESANKHHMSIYGYDKNTTPFLSFLKSNDKMYIFNAIAPVNQTQYSIPMLYTKATVRNFEQAFTHSVSLVSNFRLYGYKTYWISNQGKVGSTDTTVSSIAQEANVVTYSKKCMYTYKTKSDIEILHYLDKISDNHQKEMYVFHLMGSHADYRRRYTKAIRLFKKPKNIREKYDNTIYYTDYVIKHIVEKFKNNKVLIIYTSDHGEVVDEKKNGHAFLPPNKDEYDIPFIIYSSIPNTRIEELYKDNKKGYFNLENLNYIVEYLSGISDDNNISYSSDVFAVQPENIFDYNKLKFYNSTKF